MNLRSKVTQLLKMKTVKVVYTLLCHYERITVRYVYQQSYNYNHYNHHTTISSYVNVNAVHAFAQHYTHFSRQ